MRSSIKAALVLPLLGLGVRGQGGDSSPVTASAESSSTVSAGTSLMTSTTTLKLAKKYSGSDFYSDFDFYTDDDPTNGYVNYVSKSDAQSLALADVQSDGSFVMRADAENQASGRGRNSVRISSKDKWEDGVYILDLNHMPVGCGTWPAFWTVVESGWPTGGEIDIIEGANALPKKYGSAWNASGTISNATSSSLPLVRNTASLHTSDVCTLPSSGIYQTGDTGSTQCYAYADGNTGCGVELGSESVYGVDSFGAGVNDVGGGWFALWRDAKGSGGMYVYYWPRNATDVPDDVRDPSTSTTDVTGWGEPGANLSVPSCKGDFGKHVVVFNIDFCGDYADATYAASGCPSTCTSFVMNNPGAFAETYWSINSLRIYTASGKPAAASLSSGAIAGIVIGAIAAVALLIFIIWCCRRRRRRGGQSRRARGLYFGGGEGGSSAGEIALTPSPPSGNGSDDGIQPYKAGTGEDYAVLAGRNASSTLTSDDATLPTLPHGGTQVGPKLTKDKQGKVQVVRAQGLKAMLGSGSGTPQRVGKTRLAPGKTSQHFLAGETALRRGSEQSAKSVNVSKGGVGGFVGGHRRGSSGVSLSALGGGGGGGGGGSSWLKKAKDTPEEVARRGSVFDTGRGNGGWAG